MRKVVLGVVVFLSSSLAFGDISLTDRSAALRFITAETLTPGPTDAAARHAAAVAANKAKRDAKRNHTGKFSNLTPVPTDAAARHAAAVAENQAKRAAKHNRTGKFGALHPTAQSLHPRILATGSQALIDASGVKYFINTNITFSTSSSASAARSEASYTHAVVATTSAGGTTTSTLNDAYDGYDTLCLSRNNTVATCQTGNSNFVIYNKLGPATTSCPGVTNPLTNRQIVFPVMNTFNDVANTQPIRIQRKVFVPDNDSFSRTLNYFTNTGSSTITVTPVIANNLGSDSNTRIVTSNLGGTTVTPASSVKWVTSFQNYSGNTSSDPRLGHVLAGTGAAVPLSGLNFVDGDDNPFWGWTFTLAPGQTRIIMTFGVVQPTKAAANAKSAALSGAALPPAATQCVTATELSQIVNFASSADLSIVKSTAAPQAFGGNPITYTLAVTNNGPSPATSVSVSDVLPAGSAFVSASGTGWTCNNVAGTVTCTLPSLNVGAATPISLTITAPNPPPATLSNTATVSSATTDTNPANNSSTSVVPLLPGSAIPALSGWMLAALGLMLGLIAVVRRT